MANKLQPEPTVVDYHYKGLRIKESDGHGKNGKGNKTTSTIQVRVPGEGNGYALIRSYPFPVNDNVKKALAVRRAHACAEAYFIFPNKDRFYKLKRGNTVYLNVPKVYFEEKAVISKVDFPYVFLKGQFTLGRVTKYHLNYISLDSKYRDLLESMGRLKAVFALSIALHCVLTARDMQRKKEQQLKTK